MQAHKQAAAMAGRIGGQGSTWQGQAAAHRGDLLSQQVLVQAEAQQLLVYQKVKRPRGICRGRVYGGAMRSPLRVQHCQSAAAACRRLPPPGPHHARAPPGTAHLAAGDG
jgi:hypothetical protein